MNGGSPVPGDQCMRTFTETIKSKKKKRDDRFRAFVARNVIVHWPVGDKNIITGRPSVLGTTTIRVQLLLLCFAFGELGRAERSGRLIVPGGPPARPIQCDRNAGISSPPVVMWVNRENNRIITILLLFYY